MINDLMDNAVHVGSPPHVLALPVEVVVSGSRQQEPSQQLALEVRLFFHRPRHQAIHKVAL